MSNSERYQSDPENLPQITREAIDEFVRRPQDFQSEFTALLRENPDLAHTMTLNLEEGGGRLEFAKGALWMYTIIREALEIRQLKKLFESEYLSDDGGGEDLPLSA